MYVIAGLAVYCCQRLITFGSSRISVKCKASICTLFNNHWLTNKKLLNLSIFVIEQSRNIQNGHGDTHRVKEKVPEPRKKENKQTLEQQQSQKSEKSKSEQTVKSKTPPTKTEQKSSSSSSFGGMKKGFLFGGAPKSKPTQETKSGSVNKSQTSVSDNNQSKTGKNKTLEDIPFVRKNDENKAEELRFSEVQEAMEKTNSKLMENKG